MIYNADWVQGYYQSPIGILKLTVRYEALVGLTFVSQIGRSDDHPYLKQVMNQLEEYFSGSRHHFDIKVEFEEGTDFQILSWQALMSIPYGSTVSYQTQASMIENAKAYRAVGNANGKNPIAIVVPCHRVVSKAKGYGGYSSGLERKKWLINHEKRNVGGE